MDHGDHKPNDTMTMPMSCPMEMSFHGGNHVCILFLNWMIMENGKFIGSCFGIFAIAFIYEALKYYREKIFNDYTQSQLNQNKINGNNETLIPSNLSFKQRLFNKMHLIQTIMHLIQITLSYSLMLIIMTYNFWLFITVVLGATFGYFFFGWIRNNSVDLTEHCQ